MSNAEDQLVEVTSAFAFAETVQRLTDAIEHAGLTIFARIDHAAGAEGAGLQMPPTLVLIYGNARGGTPIMEAVPAAALDLPLRVLVRQEPDRTIVALHPVVPMLTRVGVAAELAARLEPAQLLVLNAVSGGAG